MRNIPILVIVCLHTTWVLLKMYGRSDALNINGCM